MDHCFYKLKMIKQFYFYGLKINLKFIINAVIWSLHHNRSLYLTQFEKYVHCSQWKISWYANLFFFNRYLESHTLASLCTWNSVLPRSLCFGIGCSLSNPRTAMLTSFTKLVALGETSVKNINTMIITNIYYEALDISQCYN